jgi:hypothetical protein
MGGLFAGRAWHRPEMRRNQFFARTVLIDRIVAARLLEK